MTTPTDPLKADFRQFLFALWNHIFGNPPTNNMYHFGYRLQHGPSSDILMGFRGFSKSYIVVAFAMWKLYCDPKLVILTVSGSGPGAAGNADLAWNWINNVPFLQHLKPKGNLRQSAEAFDVTGTRGEKSESFAAMSLFGQITGRRADLIIPDDVETPNTADTEGNRHKLATRYAELGGAILKPGGQIKVLGTAQTENTLYLDLALNKGYGMYMLPVVYPYPSSDEKKDEVRKYGPWLAPHIRKALEENPSLAGAPVEPTRFPPEDLAKRLLEYGLEEYNRQFRLFLDAGATSTGFKLRDIPVIEIAEPTPENPLWKVPGELTWMPSPTTRYTDMEVDSMNGDGSVYAPQATDLWHEPEGKVLVVDPSGGGSDETAWSVLAQHLGRIFLCSIAGRLEGFSEDTMKAIAADAAKWRVHKVRIEKNYGGGMFGELLRPHINAAKKSAPGWDGCEIEETTAGQVQKEVRIVDTLSGVITGHRLVIAAEVLRKDFKVNYPEVAAGKQRNYRLTYQLTRITKKKGCLAHDDRLDVVQAGVASFLGVLQRQLGEAALQAKAQYLEEQMQGMIDHAARMKTPIVGQYSPSSFDLGPLMKRLGNVQESPYMKGRAGMGHNGGPSLDDAEAFPGGFPRRPDQ